MKLLYSLFSIAITLMIIFPQCHSISAGPNETPSIVIPDSMKNTGAKPDTITFPDPKKTAFMLCHLYYDMKSYKCQEGIENGKNVKKLVMDFIATVKPANQSSPEQVKLNQDQLDATLTAIRQSFDEIDSSQCAAFLRAEVRVYRRSIFLFGLR